MGILRTTLGAVPTPGLLGGGVLASGGDSDESRTAGGLVDLGQTTLEGAERSGAEDGEEDRILAGRRAAD